MTKRKPLSTNAEKHLKTIFQQNYNDVLSNLDRKENQVTSYTLGKSFVRKAKKL